MQRRKAEPQFRFLKAIINELHRDKYQQHCHNYMLNKRVEAHTTLYAQRFRSIEAELLKAPSY